ncbi:MAG TPA: helix-turn-helix transcriptional regulator [Candidatus Paceibacterota bacterium]|nr:helix-turn-helix transcriptional regulator [Verrucomicrobiota bacterium]HRY51485.1 helix-turn-helix transcriptional regulator [Candidatus Paceibacterota bacterium]
MSTSKTGPIAIEQCPCSGRNLDKLLHAAILILLLDESLHGYELLHRLAELKMFQERPPDPTGVYRLIRRMEKDGLVRATTESSMAGPAKRSIQLTAAGRRCLRRWQETLKDFQAAIGELLQMTQADRRH